MKTNFKYDRLAEDIKEVLTKTINEEIDGCEYLSITHVTLTKDLGDAKVYFQLLDDADIDYVLEELKHNQQILKASIADNIKIRKIPNLIFKYDETLDNYNRIDSILKDEF